MKDKYKKIVIFVSNDIEKLYQNTDSILVFNKKGFIIQGQTKEVFIKDEIMKENKIDSPEIIEFTSMAKKSKKVKLDYHKDIRDLIKDIYKHV